VYIYDVIEDGYAVSVLKARLTVSIFKT